MTGSARPESAGALAVPRLHFSALRGWRERVGEPIRALRWTLLVYLASRALLMAVAILAAKHRHYSLASELGRWDGTWYIKIASFGYPTHPVSGPSTLGFFPLYSLVVWLVLHAPGPPNSIVVAGMLVSGLGGFITTVLVQRLTTGWWGEQSGRRATVLFCFFAGSIVFSMVYAEGLLLPLAAGCVLALQRRRWLLAGVLAGLGTAVQPDGVALIVVCVVSAAVELRRGGWRNPSARHSLIAPLLSVTGIGAFAIFLWLRTGTPFATLDAQRTGWGESVDPFSLVHQGQLLVHQLSHLDSARAVLYLGPASGVIGAVILLVGIVLLFKRPRGVSIEGMTLTLTIAFLGFVSRNVAPNPRILITAFPAILVLAHYCRGRAFSALLAVSTALLIVTSALTYGGHSLTP